jgi:cyanate permease
MKTTTRPTPTLPMLPAPLQQPRQLSIAFETPALLGLAADQRSTAIRVLAVMLLQAAGIHLSEDDDVEH